MPFAINGDVRLYYETLGDAADPAVLLLGGAGKQLIDFPDAFCGAIVARGFSVIRFDQRDTGLSTGFAERGSDAVGVAEAIADGRTPDLPYTTADLAADAAAVLDAAGVARAHLFGRSLGAYVAQVVALDQPERVFSLTLVMAFSRAIGTSMPRARLQALDADRFADAAHFADRQVATARAIGNAAYFDEAAIRAAAVHAFERGVPQGSIARHFMLGLAAPDLRGMLGRLSMPVQIIHGALDTIIPLALAEETAAAIPQARLTVLDDMAHEGPPQLWKRWIDLLEANARS
ncbi:MAG TPA: alpha/beta hydrolase [Sphingomonas sp.]|jgi:pimeloyl-ACP methyl ester carboxylesterase